MTNSTLSFLREQVATLREQLTTVQVVLATGASDAVTAARQVLADFEAARNLRDTTLESLERLTADFSAVKAELAESQRRCDAYADEAMRAGAQVAEIERQAAILLQYAVAGATFAGMRDEVALPIDAWPHVGEFAAHLAGAVTMHRRMSGEHEQEAPNHLDTDGRDASRDPKPGDVWVIDGRPWIVRLPDPRFIPAPNVRPEIELENCDTRRVGKSILRTVWPLFVAPHTFIRNLNELTQPPIDEHDPERPSLVQVG